MKKIFDKKIFIGIIIGSSLCSGATTYALTNYNSNQILYKKGNDNVSLSTELDNLNSYINYGDASASDIVNGKTALVNGKKVTGTMSLISSEMTFALHGSWAAGNHVITGDGGADATLPQGVNKITINSVTSIRNGGNVKITNNNTSETTILNSGEMSLNPVNSYTISVAPNTMNFYSDDWKGGDLTVKYTVSF